MQSVCKVLLVVPRFSGQSFWNFTAVCEINGARFPAPPLGLITVASGGLGWFMSGRMLRPVRVITETARRASEQHLGERLALPGPRDELKELADTFDDMLERLDAAFASQRRFVANASHELRTPLTTTRALQKHRCH